MKTIVEIIVSVEIESKNVSDLAEKEEALIVELEDAVYRQNHDVDEVTITNRY